jgi:hypothetical protein
MPNTWERPWFAAWDLSRLTKVLTQSDPGVAWCIEVRLHLSEQRRGRLLQGIQVIPPAMTGEFVLEVPPDPLDQVELRSIGWQPQGLDALVVGTLPGTGQSGSRSIT